MFLFEHYLRLTNLIIHNNNAAPNAPVITIIPTYSYKSKGLMALTTRFKELVDAKLNFSKLTRRYIYTNDHSH